MRLHRFHESRVVVVVRRANMLPRRGAPLGDGQRIERRQSSSSNRRRQWSRDVGCHDAPMPSLRELDQPAIVGRVPVPRARAGDKLTLTYSTREIVIEHGLHVALEHLERQHDGSPGEADRVEQLCFRAMSFGIIVLFAEEHDVGAGESFDHLRSRRFRDGRRRDDAITR